MSFALVVYLPRDISTNIDLYFEIILIDNRRKQIVYTYKTEILTVGTKWFSDKADANDIDALDQLINERATHGWELVTYDYMATSMQIKGAFVITFRKQQ